LCNQNALVEENEALQKRIKDAANYFSAEGLKWKESFRQHPLSTDTKKTARKIDAALNDINGTVHELLHKLNYCLSGFLLSDYLKNGKKLSGEIEKTESSYAQNKIRSMSSDELQHSVLYDRISEMRRRIGGESNMPLYIVFSNNAIKNVCVRLPKDETSLLKVKGFGKVKVKKYGDEVLEIVREYCEENNLDIQ
ncbi:MAG: HRDC domain-containing protein, partial [Bacteroidia bacterium]|nr:HRDC domain-containing protein [Bacteroidia bacterium]